jgi:hypothetical protein
MKIILCNDFNLKLTGSCINMNTFLKGFEFETDRFLHQYEHILAGAGIGYEFETDRFLIPGTLYRIVPSKLIYARLWVTGRFTTSATLVAEVCRCNVAPLGFLSLLKRIGILVSLSFPRLGRGDCKLSSMIVHYVKHVS